jgi:transposase
MYIKVTTNSAGQQYYHLVESYWENGKSRQRTLMALGRAGEDRMDEVIAAIGKHKEVLSILELAENISVDDTYILGPLLILQRFFENNGLDQILREISNKHQQLGFDLRDAVFTMAAARFVKPGSKLKVYDHWLECLYPEMVNPHLGLHQLYRALDILFEHKDEIEKALFFRGRDLFSLDVDVVLYDLTTLRFESTRTDLGKLRQFGYSKERRNDCTQVVLGLLVTPEGVPLGFEVYPGNTFEGQTIKSIVTKLREKYRVRRFIFVADRGLFSKKNLQALRADNKLGEYIVGMKLGVFKKRHEEFYDISRYHWVNDDLAVYETVHESDRCIITWSRVRAERDRQAREDILDKIRHKLAKKKVSAKEFVTHSAYKRYVTGLGEGEQPALNEQAIAQDSARDGYFGVVTNIATMTAAQIVDNYKALWIIEDAFGEFKGNLKARPVFHWRDRRIIGHLTLCFLAYYCESLMTIALRDKGLLLESKAVEDGIIKPRPLTVVEAMAQLQEVRAIPVCVRDTTIWVRTDISGNAYKLLSAVGMKPPPKVLTVRKNENLLAQTRRVPASTRND